MSQLLESNEFGDWLIAEIARTRVQAKSANPDRAHSAAQRLEALKTAKTILLEYLTLQQKMLDAASAAFRADRTPA